MKAFELLEAIGQAEDQLLIQTKEATPLVFPWKRVIALTAAVLLMLSGAISALAYASPDANQLLYQLWPWAAQALKPVHLVSEDNGIRMELISAAVDKNRALAYVSMQDMTENRIDESTDLFDSAQWQLPYDGAGHCEFISYDAESKTATFLIDMTFDTPRITGGKVTFGVSKFISHKKRQTVDLTSLVDWEKAIQEVQGVEQQEHMSRGGGYQFLDGAAEIKPLQIGQMLARVPVLPRQLEDKKEIVSGLLLEGYGTMDGILHLRVRSLDNLHTDNHLFLTLKEKEGTEYGGGFIVQDKKGNDAISVSAVSWIEGNDQVVEYMFDISNADLTGLALTADCITADPAVQGEWEVTFPLKNISNEG